MLVIAHRGASGHAPENTMAAFRKAVAQGATFIETDLQLSRDAHFVAIHDGTVNRTTNGRGSVHDLTLVELRELAPEPRAGGELAQFHKRKVVHRSAVVGSAIACAVMDSHEMRLPRVLRTGTERAS